MSKYERAEDAAEWQSWLALPKAERRSLLESACAETDVAGFCTRRMLAAKALHEHVDGFSAEDVNMLRAEAAACGGSGRGSALSDLADRIKKLLPPEGKR